MNSPKTYQALAKTAHNRLRNDLARQDIVEPALESLDAQEQALWEHGLSLAVNNQGITDEQIHDSLVKYDAELAARRGVKPVLSGPFNELKAPETLRYSIMREAAEVFRADVLSAGTEQEIDALPDARTQGTAFESQPAVIVQPKTDERDPQHPRTDDLEDGKAPEHQNELGLDELSEEDRKAQAELDAEDPEFREGQRLSDDNQPLPEDASDAKQRGFYSRKDVGTREGGVGVS